MIGRLVAALAAAFLALLGCLALPQAVSATPAHPAASYTYFGDHAATDWTRTPAERGPPASNDNAITDLAVDRWSDGASARAERNAAPPITYDYPATLVQVARATTMSGTHVGTTNGHLSLLSGFGVAANSGDGVVRHYTTSGAAEGIMKGGTIEPGLKSGKIWVTPDRYASGAEARAKLALDKTPNGYFEIPMCRIKCPTGPSRVEPWNGEPGGGIEIITREPIDITDLPFRRFD